MPLRPQPCYQPHQIGPCHRRATSGRPVYAATSMKKNRAACARDRWIGIMPDLDQPVIRKIAGSHLLVGVIIRRVLRINHDMSVVIGRAGVVTPHVCFGDLMIWIIGPGGQVRFIAKNLADFKNSRRRSSIALFFSKRRLVLSDETCSPANPVFSKQRWERSSHWRPIAAMRSFKQSQLSAH